MRLTAFPNKITHQRQLASAAVQAKSLHRRRALVIWGARILLCGSLLVLWQLVSGTLIRPLFISSPLAVWNQLVAWISDGTLWFNMEITLQEILLGLVFGTISGILIGFLFGIQQVLAKIFDPFIVAVYSIPKVALAPLFILWFGVDIQMKVILVTVTVFFLIFLNTLAGVRNVDQDLIDAVLLMGGKPRDILFKVIVPSANDSVLTGLHSAIPFALLGAVIGELIATNRGIGYLLENSAATFDTAGLFVALLTLTVIAALLNAIVNIIDWKTSRWKAGVSMGRKIQP